MQHPDAFPQEVYQQFFATSQEAVIIARPGGRCAAANSAAELLLGYSSDELLKLPCTAIVDLADPASSALFSRVGVDPAVRGTGRFVRKDGSRFEAMLSSSSFRLDDGALWASVSLHDLTAAERLQRELQEARDHLSDIVEGLCEGVIVIDDQGILRSCNSSASAILGLPAEYLLGRPMDSSNWPVIRRDGSPFPTQQYPTVVAMNTGKPVTDVEFGFYRATGELLWLRLSARPLFRHGQSRPHAIVASFEDVTQRTKLELELRKQALTDPLTGVANRRALLERVQQLFDLSRRAGIAASMLMIDIDNFKAVNDSFGHAVGDDVLKEVVECIGTTLRRTDFLARIGGDEFCILLPDTDQVSGAEMAARLAAAIDRMTAEMVGIEAIRVGVSIGLATLMAEDQSFRSWMRRADDACYASKAQRRMPADASKETL